MRFWVDLSQTTVLAADHRPADEKYRDLEDTSAEETSMYNQERWQQMGRGAAEEQFRQSLAMSGGVLCGPCLYQVDCDLY